MNNRGVYKIYEQSLTEESGISLLNDVNNNINNLIDKNNGRFDGFYRQRFSMPETIFDSKQLNDKQPLFWDDQLVSGSGGASTYNTNQASTTLSVSLNTAGKRVRQTFRRFNYQPGKSQMWIMTTVFGSNSIGIKRKVGLFDEKNGLFFDQNEIGMAVTIRTYTSGSPIDTRIPQTAWNIDKMDGNGLSKINLNWEKVQILFCDFEWLGVGTCRFGLFLNGRPYYIHEVHHSNIDSVVYMSVPNLPLRYEIENTGTGKASELKHICSTVISEGGQKETGSQRGINRAATPLVTLNSTAIFPLCSIRLNSNNFTSQITDISFSFVCTSTAAFAWYLIMNPTIAGTPLSFVSITNSSVEADVTSLNGSTISPGTGTIIKTNVSQQQNEAAAIVAISGDFQLGSSISGTSDVLVLAIQRLTGITETFYGAINWVETN